MSEALRTFMNIFDSDAVNKIIIPKIQRDYAQGRNTAEIRRVRERFLDALYKAVTVGPPIKLDFVYGNLHEDGTLTPLDGQQRLTTLFLLHWYAARKEHVPPAETAFLKNFSYDTRPDSREFCRFLIDCDDRIRGKISDALENSALFPLGWKKDPTVSSMLVMLDAIEEKFRGVKNLWDKLKGGAISFYFLSIEDLKLTDEIYVTMNSRGKPLTDFEHFKAEFKRRLDDIDRELSDRIVLKIDTVWTDLLWAYRKKISVDSGFLAYFGFLCNVILYRKDGTPRGKSRDPFDLLEEFFGGGEDIVRVNVDFMERNFDCWAELSKREPIEKFFADRVSVGSRTDKTVNHHEPGKIVTYFDEADFFGDCLRSGKNFSLGKVVMLYAFVVYLLNAKKISDANFRRRIRIVNNLVTNSAGAELSDSATRHNGNRIPAMLEQVKNIIIDGKILPFDKLTAANKFNFNATQLKEEQDKLSWTIANPDKADSLFALEDHYLLYGQIGVVGLEYPEYFARFIELFNCDYDKISCALLIKGDYYQIDGNGRRYQLGSVKPQSWQNLFHKSVLAEGFDNTESALSNILYGAHPLTNDYLQQIIHDYLADCQRRNEFDWKYYFVKYPAFRPKRYGKYWWEDFSDEPYCFVTLYEQQKRSTNSYQPFLKAIGVGEISRDDLGMRLVFGEHSVTCENDAYVVYDINTGKIKDRLPIAQRNGLDTEDRVAKFAAWV